MMNNVFSALDVKFFNSLIFDPWAVSLFLVLFVAWHFYTFNPYSLFSLFNYMFQGSRLWVYQSFQSFNYLLFYFVLFFNISGLFPYFFGVTSHVYVNFVFSLFVCISIYVYSLVNSFVGLFAHFVPFSSGVLSGFLFFVEFISYWVRIFTLALRLTVNMTAGHIFLHLFGSSFSFSMSLFVLFFVMFYLFFEVFVSVIQASVYSLLLNSYMSD